MLTEFRECPQYRAIENFVCDSVRRRVVINLVLGNNLGSMASRRMGWWIDWVGNIVPVRNDQLALLR